MDTPMYHGEQQGHDAVGDLYIEEKEAGSDISARATENFHATVEHFSSECGREEADCFGYDDLMQCMYRSFSSPTPRTRHQHLDERSISSPPHSRSPVCFVDEEIMFEDEPVFRSANFDSLTPNYNVFPPIPEVYPLSSTHIHVWSGHRDIFNLVDSSIRAINSSCDLACDWLADKRRHMVKGITRDGRGSHCNFVVRIFNATGSDEGDVAIEYNKISGDSILWHRFFSVCKHFLASRRGGNSFQDHEEVDFWKHATTRCPAAAPAWPFPWSKRDPEASENPIATAEKKPEDDTACDPDREIADRVFRRMAEAGEQGNTVENNFRPLSVMILSKYPESQAEAANAILQVIRQHWLASTSAVIKYLQDTGAYRELVGMLKSQDLACRENAAALLSEFVRSASSLRDDVALPMIKPTVMALRQSSEKGTDVYEHAFMQRSLLAMSSQLSRHFPQHMVDAGATHVMHNFCNSSDYLASSYAHTALSNLRPVLVC